VVVVVVMVVVVLLLLLLIAVAMPSATSCVVSLSQVSFHGHACGFQHHSLRR
jgi:hypothetical protein